MNEDQFDKEFDLESSIQLIKTANQELLDRLGSDYDDNGVPYWEKQ